MTQPTPSVTPRDVENALLDAIRVCANAANKTPESGAALQCAQAAREMAEAYQIVRHNS